MPVFSFAFILAWNNLFFENHITQSRLLLTAKERGHIMTNDSISSITSTKPISSSDSASIKLTNATKVKLEALGINTTNIKTEIQGQAALRTAEEKRKALQKLKTESANRSQEVIKTEAKSLAAQVGASVSDDDSVSDILIKVASKVNDLKASAGDDSTKQAEADQDQAKYEALANEYSSVQAAQSKLSGSMDGLAQLNKIYQNI